MTKPGPMWAQALGLTAIEARSFKKHHLTGEEVAQLVSLLGSNEAALEVARRWRVRKIEPSLRSLVRSGATAKRLRALADGPRMLVKSQPPPPGDGLIGRAATAAELNSAAAFKERMRGRPSLRYTDDV